MRPISAAVLISTAAALVIAYAARSVFTPLICAFLAAFMLEPILAALARKTGRSWAVGIVLAAGLGLAGAGAVWLAPKAVSEVIGAAEAVRRHAAPFKATLESWMNLLPPDLSAKAAELVSTYGGKMVAWGAHALGAGIGMLGRLAAAASQVVLFAVSFVFLMLDFEKIRPGGMEILRRFGCTDAAVRNFEMFLDESGAILRAFFRGQIIYAAALGILTAAGLWIIDLPYGLTIGLAVGVLSLIPYAGVALGLLVALAVSVYAVGGFLHAALTAGVFGLVQFIDAVYLSPKLLGGAVGIHPLAAVIALLAFSELFGVFGLLMAMPLAAIALGAVRRLTDRVETA
ncbi:AI-2E family transporter [bacterium]|nr:AI-2E family transporter [bacterium]